jgi:hypothetical protein
MHIEVGSQQVGARRSIKPKSTGGGRCQPHEGFRHGGGEARGDAAGGIQRGPRVQAEPERGARNKRQENLNEVLGISVKSVHR